VYRAFRIRSRGLAFRDRRRDDNACERFRCKTFRFEILRYENGPDNGGEASRSKTIIGTDGQRKRRGSPETLCMRASTTTSALEYTRIRFQRNKTRNYTRGKVNVIFPLYRADEFLRRPSEIIVITIHYRLCRRNAQCVSNNSLVYF